MSVLRASTGLSTKRSKDAGSVAYRSPTGGVVDRPARERLRTLAETGMRAKGECLPASVRAASTVR